MVQVQGGGSPKRGTIKWVSEEKGFGFITPESGKDIFVHHSEVIWDELKDLRAGDTVSFDVEERRAGPAAVRVLRRANRELYREFAELDRKFSEPGREPDEHVFLLDEDGKFKYLPCTRGPAGNIIIESSDLASLLTDASLPNFQHGKGRLWQLCAEFEALINEPTVPESVLQEFFEEHPEFLLADQFEALYPQVVLPLNSQGAMLRPDFILRPFAGVSYEPQIVELKLPRQSVVSLSGNHVGLYAPVHRAVDQLHSYARAFENDGSREEIAEKLGFTAHRPTLALIVGRAADLPAKRITALARERMDPVQLRTYDDLLLQFRKRAGLG